MPKPSQKEALPPSPVRIGLIIFFVIAAAITFTAFILSKMQTAEETAQSTIDTNVATTCENTCRACVPKEYDARCFDRCRFGFKPYCD